MKPAVVRYYFDADILGLGKVIARLRADSTYPGDIGDVIHKRVRPPCLVTSTDTPDEDWIPEVTAAGYLIISRDGWIGRRVAERRAIVEHGARMVVLAPRDAKTVWAQLEVVMSQWRSIEKLLELTGPFIYRASRTTLRQEDV